MKNFKFQKKVFTPVVDSDVISLKRDKAKTSKLTNGFTLVEIMVSLSVFLIIMTLVAGSILSILNINNKANTKKTAMDNLNFALESMSRIVRFSKNYHCGSSGDITQPLNCPSGGTSISVLSADGATTITYAFSGGSLTRTDGVGGTPYPVVSPELVITSGTFYVNGSLPYGSDYTQPSILITISGYVGTKTNTQTAFKMETTISQRALDI